MMMMLMGLKRMMIHSVVILSAMTAVEVQGQQYDDLDLSAPFAILRSLGGCATLTWIEGPAMMWEWICEDGPYVAIKPDKQGFYRATLYTGFQEDSTSPTSHPQSKQAYKWKGTGWIDLNSLGCLSQENGPLLPAWYIAPCTPGQHDYKGEDVMNPYYKFEEWKLNGRHSTPQEWLKPQLSTSMLLPSKDGDNNNNVGMDQFNAGNPLELGAAAAADTTTSPIAEAEVSDSLGSTNRNTGLNSFSVQNSPVAAETSVSPGNIELATTTTLSNPGQGMGEITFGRKRGVKRRRRGQTGGKKGG